MKIERELVINGYSMYLEDPGIVQCAYKKKRKEAVVGGILPGVEPPSVELKDDISWTAKSMVVIVPHGHQILSDLFKENTIISVVIVDGQKRLFGEGKIERLVISDHAFSLKKAELDLVGRGELIDL